MKSLSSVGLGLSVVFGCLLLALIAELYYLLWWKNRFTNRGIEDDDYISPTKELLYMFCWKKSSSSSAYNPQELCSVTMTDNLVHEPENFLIKPFDEDSDDTEFTRLQTLSCPPRFLFTIIEETIEDLELENGKSCSSLNDETPYLTPLTSPPFFTPPLTPIESFYSHQGFNPLYESSSDAEFNRIRSSPPPKFKFLQDAEEKLYRRKLLEDEGNEKDGSFITIFIDSKNDHRLSQFHSTSSQVMPLANSPSKFRPSPISQ